ncbi:MAG: hypothetical protein ACTFAL_04775 [Candidatus Electronema sp. V4]|uniref:hypothetical protein n=1 Tax=Candidatus Electronema sp. V4 TaxID=3454756 RepID=UPI0040554247
MAEKKQRRSGICSAGCGKKNNSGEQSAAGDRQQLFFPRFPVSGAGIQTTLFLCLTRCLTIHFHWSAT